MSVIKPEIETLLENAGNNEFLLCAMASERSRDITDMMHGQRDRALNMQSSEELARISGQNPLDIALDEISDGLIAPYVEGAAATPCDDVYNIGESTIG